MVVGEGNQVSACEQDDWAGEHGQDEEHSEERRDGVDKAAESLGERHVLDERPGNGEAELKGRLHGSDGPSSPLLQVACERVWDGAVLQWFVNEGRMPAIAQEHAGATDILGQ